MDTKQFEAVEGGPNSVACSQCGSDAQWRYTDAGQTRVEVLCPDCGSFELTRAEFDEAETDIAG